MSSWLASLCVLIHLVLVLAFYFTLYLGGKEQFAFHIAEFSLEHILCRASGFVPHWLRHNLYDNPELFFQRPVGEVVKLNFGAFVSPLSLAGLCFAAGDDHGEVLAVAMSTPMEILSSVITEALSFR